MPKKSYPLCRSYSDWHLEVSVLEMIGVRQRNVNHSVVYSFSKLSCVSKVVHRGEFSIRDGVWEA